jgi:hypothetical protein
MLDGDGSGLEGLGGEPGLPGAPNAGMGRTEMIPATDSSNPPERPSARLLKDEPPQLGLPVIDDGQTPLNSELTIELAKIAQDADDQVKKAMDIPPTPPTSSDTKKHGAAGTGNSKGTGGKGGKGGGPGIGNKSGPGIGKGGVGGRLATKQDVYAARWHFDISGDAKEHARKLAAMGVTLAFPDPKGGFFVVKDLNRRPVDRKKESLVAFKDAVKWYNTRRESVQALANELQLGFTPEYIVLLLPKEREEKMASEEARYAAANRRNPQAIGKTWFDFRLNNGAYDPTVIRQE